jgi:hypothetical protein
MSPDPGWILAGFCTRGECLECMLRPQNSVTALRAPVWMAPALQAIFAIAMVCQYSRVSGLFTWRVPLALMSSASKVPIGLVTSRAGTFVGVSLLLVDFVSHHHIKRLASLGRIRRSAAGIPLPWSRLPR